MTNKLAEAVELLPCPFCKSEWVVINRPANGSQPAVKCKACNATGPYTAGMTDEQIIAAWNTHSGLRCAICETAVVWEHEGERGTMVCSCNSTQWVPGKGMMPWEDGYENSLVLVRAAISVIGVDPISEAE